MNLKPSTVRSPLQLFGFYLAWMETALAGSLFATESGTYPQTKSFLMISMGIGAIVFVLTAAFLLIYLTVKKPGFLFNPGDYDPAVQPMLFDRPTPILAPDPAPAPTQPATGPQVGGGI